MLALLSIGPFEIVMLGLVAVMLFGGDLPLMMRKAGRAIGRLRRLSAELSRMIDDAADETERLASPKRPPEEPDAPAGDRQPGAEEDRPEDHESTDSDTDRDDDADDHETQDAADGAPRDVITREPGFPGDGHTLVPSADAYPTVPRPESTSGEGVGDTAPTPADSPDVTRPGSAPRGRVSR